MARSRDFSQVANVQRPVLCERHHVSRAQIGPEESRRSIGCRGVRGCTRRIEFRNSGHPRVFDGKMFADRAHELRVCCRNIRCERVASVLPFDEQSITDKILQGGGNGRVRDVRKTSDYDIPGERFPGLNEPKRALNRL
jgi:hypothetical protein